MEKVINQIRYVYEKTKINFIEKYCLVDRSYTKDDLVLLYDDLVNISSNLDEYITNMNNVYKLLDFNPEIHGEYLIYLYGNVAPGLYETYKSFINGNDEEIECLKYVIGLEVNDSTVSFFENVEKPHYGTVGVDFDYNEYGKNLVERIASNFYFSYHSAAMSTFLTLETAKEVLFNPEILTPFTNGIVFYDEGRDKLLEDFINICGVKRYYQIEFEEEIVEEDLTLLNTLYNDLKKDMSQNIVVIIKNINYALESKKLRRELLLFFDDVEEIDGLKFFITCKEVGYFNCLEEISGIRLYSNGKTTHFDF